MSEMQNRPLKDLHKILSPYARGEKDKIFSHPEQALAAQRITEDFVGRLDVLLDLGLGYLSLERSTPTLSPGELQRLRLATQVKSNLFGVVYVLDEPSAGLHPSDTEALLRAFHKLKDSGNSIFVVEHEIDIIHEADWIIDVGPKAGEKGGEILYSGPLSGLKKASNSETAHYLFAQKNEKHLCRKPHEWINFKNLTRNNLRNVNVEIPLGIMTAVTGISGSGKSTLVSQLMVELILKGLGIEKEITDELPEFEEHEVETLGGEISGGLKGIKRLVVVDQKPIGRTPRSNLATYTGLFDHVRKIFASTKLARSRHYDAGRFSFNLPKGRCENCEGEGFVMVELLFLPSVYSPCPVCGGSRFNAKTLEVTYKDKTIADVLRMNVDEAKEFFHDTEIICRSLKVLQEVGLGYLRLGQPATELSGGEAQRIKLATELQKISRGESLYILDEPTTGLHPSDVERLLHQLNKLTDAGNTIVVVEHDMRVILKCDWVIDMGPGAGDEGGKVIYAGTPEKLTHHKSSKTGHYLKNFLP